MYCTVERKGLAHRHFTGGKYRVYVPAATAAAVSVGATYLPSTVKNDKFSLLYGRAVPKYRNTEITE